MKDEMNAQCSMFNIILKMETTKQITVFNVYLHIALALSLTFCGPNKVLEVEFGKSNNTFPCEGLHSNESVTWSLTQPDLPGQQLVLGVCQPLSTSGEFCKFVSRDIFYLQRIYDTSSDLIINASGPGIRDNLPKGVAMTCASMQNSETCLIDLVYPAEGVTCSVQFRSGTWSFIGQCNISTAYSTLIRYSCQWFQTQNDKTIFLTTTNITYNTSSTSGNITGFCILNTSLPLDNGIYTVTVGITPGHKNFTSTFIGNNTIYKPSFVPNITCAGNNGQYAQDGAELACTCTVPNLGQPPGRLVFYWHTNIVIYGNYSEKRVLTTQRVTRQDNRAVIKCVLEWDTRNDLYVNYTIAVAYGPDEISINAPLVFDIRPSKPDTLNITCNSSEAYPSVTYQWTGRCSNESGRTCSFLPTPAENSANITCTVSNSISNITRKASHHLEFNYPPAHPPVIVDYSGEPLYSGQSKTISCNVSGGNPPVRNVTLNCQGQSHTDDGQMTNITLALNSSHNGQNCTCRSFWKNPDWYTSFATVTLLVYYPPQTPGIAYRAQQYPFLEGDPCTLFCGFPNGADRGNPPAHLAWQSQQVTIVMGTDSSNVSLTLYPLNKTHNGRNFVCDAVNNFTTFANTSVSANVTIEVYYRPIVTLSVFPETACLSNSTRRQCVLVDGQFIDINCTADSNPRPKKTFWRTARFTLPSNQSENLHIVSANHSLHTGIYLCNATSEGNGNDSRLPLSSESELHIIVKYKAEQINMSLNSEFGNLSVNEHENLTIGCQANGRPTPKLLLYKGNTSSQLLQRETGGILNINDEISVLSYSINSLHCENSSLFTCIARNEVENSSIKATQQLYVNCKPRYAGGDSLVLIYNEHPLSLKLKLVAYPVPDVINVKFLGLSPNWNNSDGTVTENIFHVTCLATETLYDIHCEIIVDNITSKEQEGYYKLEFSNDYGKEIIVYEIKVPSTKESTTSYAAAIGGGVGGAIVIIAIIIAICFVLQRRGKEKLNEQESLRRKETIEHSLKGRKLKDGEQLIVNDMYASAGTYGGTTEPLSMNPQRDFTEYENVAFEKDNTEDAGQDIVYPKENRMHEDGLVYTTVQFSDKQGKRDELPPKLEPTEYAKIDFSKTQNGN